MSDRVFQWSSAFSRAQSPADCVNQCVKSLDLTESPHIVFFFVSDAFAANYGSVLGLLRERFPKARLLGCSASGLVGRGTESEYKPGLSMLAGYIPGVELDLFRMDVLPDLDGPPEAWRQAVTSSDREIQGMVLLADPFTFDGRSLLAGLDFAFPKAAKVGGLASGCQQLGEAALFLDNDIYHDGLVGVAFSGPIEVLPVVAQGCQGFGKQYVITDSQANMLLELDGKPALEALGEMVESLTDKEREAYLATTIFVGLGAGGPSLNYRAGDFLVRQVLGSDPRTGAVAVGGRVRNGQTVQFHLRNGDTSRDDLAAVLGRVPERASGVPRGALMFSCLGRGEGLYGESGHDSRVFGDKVGPLPISGFFCNGEIGPVGNETCLHGFTTSFALFCQPSMEGDTQA